VQSTALAVEYCTSPPSVPDALPGEEEGGGVKFVVLDSPYTSVKQLVVDGSKAVKCFGLAIPEPLVRLACRGVRAQVSAKLGCDPFDLTPLRLVQQMQGQGGGQLPPCQIFSALQDDYIPASHGRELQQAWRGRGAACSVKEFAGRHFGERDAQLLRGAAAAIRGALRFDKAAEEAAASAAMMNSLHHHSAGGKVPWAGVW
jgi:hypothetical protein